jgi:hypothetical protein
LVNKMLSGLWIRHNNNNWLLYRRLARAYYSKHAKNRKQLNNTSHTNFSK